MKSVLFQQPEMLHLHPEHLNMGGQSPVVASSSSVRPAAASWLKGTTSAASAPAAMGGPLPATVVASA